MFHRGVIPLAGHIDAVLRAFQLVLQVQKILIGLKVGITFHYHHEPGEGGRETALRLQHLLHGLGIAQVLGGQLYAGGLGPGLDDGLQGLLFMGSIAFYGRHQVGNQIRPALQIGIDVAPGFEDSFFHRLQFVVAATGRHQGHHEQQRDAQQGFVHDFLHFFMQHWGL